MTGEHRRCQEGADLDSGTCCPRTGRDRSDRQAPHGAGVESPRSAGKNGRRDGHGGQCGSSSEGYL